MFPKDPINTQENDPHFVSGNIVEKRFTFPSLADSESGSSVEELGHHAGYYRLPRSKAARYGCQLRHAFLFIYLFIS